MLGRDRRRCVNYVNSMVYDTGSLNLQVDWRGDVGTACVTLFKKMRPFSNKGVLFFFCCPGPPGNDKGAGTDCFFKSELLLPPFCLLFGGGCNASLQQSMIF